jgi:hypothetical protein
MKGSNSREEILNRLVESSVDSDAGQTLRAESDPIKLIEAYSARLSN